MILIRKLTQTDLLHCPVCQSPLTKEKLNQKVKNLDCRKCLTHFKVKVEQGVIVNLERVQVEA